VIVPLIVPLSVYSPLGLLPFPPSLGGCGAEPVWIATLRKREHPETDALTGGSLIELPGTGCRTG
jgi:hypothetical protein